MLSDAELVRAAQSGDAVGLGILLERHRAPLHALALNIFGHGPEAQDIVQDVFVVALSSIDRLREPEAVGGWLRSILRNLCYTRFRKTHGWVPLEEPVLEPTELSIEEHMDRLALREWVWTALLKLPEALRVTAMLRYFGSRSSYEEISAILGVPMGTVGSRLGQVKVKLADALLETAALEHDEARQISDSQTRFFTEALDELNRGSYERLASAFADDVMLFEPESSAGRGLELLIKGTFEVQIETGVKLHPTNVLASKDVAVIEGIFENPPENPFLCPPATSIVGFYRDGRIHRSLQYCAPRPEDQHDHR